MNIPNYVLDVVKCNSKAQLNKLKQKKNPPRVLNYGLDKLKNLFTAINFYGGPKKAFLQLVRTDELKVGKLVGEDKFGNKYYENNNFFYGRNRWIVYSNRYGYDYDASQVPVEWYGWLHFKTDLLPHEDPARPKHKWIAEHTENYTGTPLQYVPYSTTRRKIEPWIPPKGKKNV